MTMISNSLRRFRPVASLLSRALPATTLATTLVIAAFGSTAGAVERKTIKVGVRHTIEAELFIPDGPGPFPIILELETSAGVGGADWDHCAEFARAGYICLVPKHLEAYGVTNEARRRGFTTDARAIFDELVAAIEQLEQMPQAKPGAVGAIGYSNGGFFAALLASAHKVKAAVGYYGAYDGAMSQPDLHTFKRFFNPHSAPMLILHGEYDGTVNRASALKLAEIIRENGGTCEIVIYPNAGHDFERAPHLPGDGAAMADARIRTAAFFKQYVR
jgi:carboxymethylenebutenolidase